MGLCLSCCLGGMVAKQAVATSFKNQVSSLLPSEEEEKQYAINEERWMNNEREYEKNLAEKRQKRKPAMETAVAKTKSDAVQQVIARRQQREAMKQIDKDR